MARGFLERDSLFYVVVVLGEGRELGKGRMILRRSAPLFLLLADALAVEMIRKLNRDVENPVSG